MSIAAEPLHRLVQTTFEHAGTTAEEARLVADHLVEANLMGHDSHGVIRVQPYVNLLRAGRTTTGKGIRITRDAGALVTVDGQVGVEFDPARDITLLRDPRATHLMVADDYDFFALLREKL